jgi:hypothetical protein
MSNLRSLLDEAKKDSAALSSRVEELTADLQKTEADRSRMAESLRRVQTELADAQASLSKWKSGEISQIGIATAKAAGQIGLGVVLATVRKKLSEEEDEAPHATSAAPIYGVPSTPPSVAQPIPQPSAMPVSPAVTATVPSSPSKADPAPSRPAPSAPTRPETSPRGEPQQTEEERYWRNRIRTAEATGWRSVDDPIVLSKRRALTSQGRLPSQTDLEYLAIHEAIEARRAYHREYVARWEIEDFKLDAQSELHLKLKLGIMGNSSRERIMASRALSSAKRRPTER